MPKKTLRRFMPDPHFIRNHKSLQFLGRALHDPNLFHLNRRSASGAMAVGLFWAFIPMPFQMAPAALCALLFRVNLPISIALVWLTNPLTMGPIFYMCYKIGALLTGENATSIDGSLFEWNGINEFFDLLGGIGLPLLVGALAVGSISALVGWGGMRLLWRYSVIQHLRRRQLARHTTRS